MKPKPWLVAVIVGSILGLLFAGLSTYDFVQHLDRQVHALHCSFNPGARTSLGESGCQAALMSEYSSVFRAKVWGGVPIALPAMAVFGFIAAFAIDLLLTRRKDDRRATAFLALACGLPALTSIVMLTIALTQVGSLCKLCVAIYLASLVCLAGAVVAWRAAVRSGGDRPRSASGNRRREPPRAAADEPAALAAGGRATAYPEVLDLAESQPTAAANPRRERPPNVAGPEVSYRWLGGAFAVGLGFVLVPEVAYVAMAPDHTRFIGTCDVLAKPADTYNIMVPLARSTGGVPSIEILDPLCPACRAFETRLAGAGLAARLDRKAVLFPLDNTCNWMVTEATHPGACTVSEAVLCAKDQAPAVIAWAFAEQARIRTESKADPGAAARMVKQRFPELAACVGSAEARARLNKSLRWAVANNLRVLTPQLFVDNVRLCDEDVDLGLEYTLGHMLERHASHTLGPAPVEAPAGAAVPPMMPAPTASQPAATGAGGAP